MNNLKLAGHFKFPAVLIALLTVLSWPAFAQYSWDQIDYRANLYELRDSEIRRGGNIDESNRQMMEEIRNYKPSTNGRAEGVTYEQALKIVQMTNQNDVTGNRSHSKYDPNGIRGFCFGRALYAHLELLRHGVDAQAIKKVFIVGPMKNGVDWQFHVTTVVRAKDKNGWYAVDTFTGRPMLLEEWFSRFTGYSTDKKLRMYVTRPAKIGPSSWEYNTKPGGLFDPFYNSYFKDMFEMFRKTRVSSSEKFVQRCSQLFL